MIISDKNIPITETWQKPRTLFSFHTYTDIVIHNYLQAVASHIISNSQTATSANVNKSTVFR